ncbi:MAG: hypothetical protein JW939_05865 [Candidatus Thermoplasmatota archaeon]|nr:hypothetical protein [Candidatus Thermoplasmatota archaeon]
MVKRKKGRRKRPISNEDIAGIPASTLDSFLTDIEALAEDADNIVNERRDLPPAPSIRVRETLDGPEKVMEKISAPERTEISFPGDEITAREARTFLDALKQHLAATSRCMLYFHNDMDGLNGAIFIRSMIRNWFGDDMDVYISSMEYRDIQTLDIDGAATYLFVDIDMDLQGDNIFRVDHHGLERNLKSISNRLFLLTPPENDYDYPSTATALCAYLEYISRGGGATFFEYLNAGPWQNDQFRRLLILLASVCDNLWHLNFLIDIPIKRWIPDREEEKYLILISISASLILGEKDRRDAVMANFFIADLTPDAYLGQICQSMQEAQNIMDLALTISRGAEDFYNRIFFNLTDSTERSFKTLERLKGSLARFDNSMPADMKDGPGAADDVLNGQEDIDAEHLKRVKFYHKEIEKLRSKVKAVEKRLIGLRSAKKMISTEKGPRLCVVLPAQSSAQVKGIIASLLYYMGWKNVVIEERGAEAFWGSRGFSREMIGDLFSSLSFTSEELEDYILMENILNDLSEIFDKEINISRNISYHKTYSGGMGGRGLVFGGVVTGTVPRVFSLLEETGDMEEKVQELIRYKQLGNALQGLTGGQSTVTTAHALRAKFRSTGWMVLQMVPGRHGADVMLGNFKKATIHLVGYTERIDLELRDLTKTAQ